MFGYVGCELIFPVVPYYTEEFGLRIAVYYVPRRQFTALIHPHIERCIVHVRKSAVRCIQLI